MSSSKLQRWIDLLAALLGRQRAITFEEIAREVPAYNGKERATAKRQFERDKRDLKAFGVPIESEGEDGDTDFRYRLRTADFPYGLFFLNAHWYLVARDVDRGALRNFRVNRIAGVKQLAPDREVPQYEIPGSFVLREHARSRLAWELGDNEVVSVTVEFRGSSGAVIAAAALGSPVTGAHADSPVDA